jgi:hypothetical protein
MSVKVAMNNRIRKILDQITVLENELQIAVEEQQERLHYRIEGMRVMSNFWTTAKQPTSMSNLRNSARHSLNKWTRQASRNAASGFDLSNALVTLR